MGQWIRVVVGKKLRTNSRNDIGISNEIEFVNGDGIGSGSGNGIGFGNGNGGFGAEMKLSLEITSELDFEMATELKIATKLDLKMAMGCVDFIHDKLSVVPYNT